MHAVARAWTGRLSDRERASSDPAGSPLAAALSRGGRDLRVRLGDDPSRIQENYGGNCQNHRLANRRDGNPSKAHYEFLVI